MDDLAKALCAAFATEARRVFKEMIESVEMFADLPPVSTTQELATALRVSDDIVRRNAEDGMPHAHAGRELRFIKALIIEWVRTGSCYSCEICQTKSGKSSAQTIATPALETAQPLPVNQTGSGLSNETQKRLADFAAPKGSRNGTKTNRAA